MSSVNNMSQKSTTRLPKIYRQTGELLTAIDTRQKENPKEDSLTSFIKTAEEKPETVAHIPDSKEQIEALKTFQSGGISYSEMRMRCG